MRKSSKKIAIVISYLYLLINTISQIILTPFYLKQIGIEEYGLYQMIYSVAQYILILDCGISTTMTRYISEYRAQKDKKGEQGFGFLIFVFVLIAIGLIYIIGKVVRNNLSVLYTSLTESELDLSITIFSVMILQIMITVFAHYFEGIIMAYERYVFSKSMGLLKIFITFVLNYIFIYSGMGIIGIVSANTVAIFVTLLIEGLYVIIVLKFRIKYTGVDKKIIIPAISLMVAMLLQSIIGHVNATIDKTLLGMYSIKADVTTYSVANTFVTFFNTVPTVISSVFLPSAVKLVVGNAGNEKLTDFVIKPGRIQFMAVGLMLIEFAIVGKSFIIRWAGEDLKMAWIIALIIMVPNAVPLIQNVCLSILNAKNKRLGRSIILVFIALLNIIVSIFLINKIKLLGAPIGTCISYIVGHCIIMNIYYKKEIGLNVKRMFTEILCGTYKCIIYTLLISSFLYFFEWNLGYLEIVVKAILVFLIYVVFLYRISLNAEEKEMFVNMVKRLKRE